MDYGEPWAWDSTFGGRTLDRQGGQRYGQEDAAVAPVQQRVVACVNACAGVSDPQPGELERLRSETALLIAMQRAPERVTRIIASIRALGERAAAAERERDEARAQLRGATHARHGGD